MSHLKCVKINKLTLLIISVCCLSMSGVKCKKETSLTKEEELPALTQKGANTFGFVLNGKVWLPKGALLQDRLNITYDANFNGGTLNITAHRYLDGDQFQNVAIASYNISKTGTYSIDKDKVLVSFYKTGSCTYSSNEIVPKGVFKITKLDLTEKVISGSFEFVLEKQGCEIINATEGRFDLKI